MTDKAFETLRAECALVRSVDDRGRECFVVSRWTLTRELPDLAAVAEWLAMVTSKTAKAPAA